jgi:hypothetical protein
MSNAALILNVSLDADQKQMLIKSLSRVASALNIFVSGQNLLSYLVAGLAARRPYQLY